jgi:hypothetical protein
VLYKHHLQQGVSKGKVTQEAADAKFAEWEAEKQSKIGNKVTSLVDAKREEAKKRMAAEEKVRESRAAAVRAKMTAAEAPAESPAEGEAPAEDVPAAE